MSTTDLNDQQIKELLEGITEPIECHEWDDFLNWRKEELGKVRCGSVRGNIYVDNDPECKAYHARYARLFAAAPALVAQLQRQRDEKDEALKMSAWNVENAQEQLHKKVGQLSELRQQLAAAQAEVERLKQVEAEHNYGAMFTNTNVGED